MERRDTNMPNRHDIYSVSCWALNCKVGREDVLTY